MNCDQIIFTVKIDYAKVQTEIDHIRKEYKKVKTLPDAVELKLRLLQGLACSTEIKVPEMQLARVLPYCKAMSCSGD